MKTLRGHLFVVLCALGSLTSEAQNSTPCGGSRKTIVPWADNGIYMSGKPSGFNYLPTIPGDTIVIKAQHNTWQYFSIEDFHGTEACPLVIINEGGQVVLQRGIDIRNSSHIKLTGSGSPSNYYGIKVHNPDAWDNNGVAIGIQGRSHHIEVERIFVHKKTYGAWIKQDPTCIDSLNYPSFRMDNIKFHDSKFLNIGQDCIYAGNTDPLGYRPVYCNGVETHPVPMRLSNIQIYNLTIDSCVRTGIQLSGCDSGYNAIYNNVVTRCGYELNQQQGTGISLGGMTSNTHVYNNVIRQTFLYGILAVGTGTNYIENNDVDSSGYLGNIINTWSQPANIYIDTRTSLPFDSTRVVIKNNRLGLTASSEGISIYFEKTVNSYAHFNVICNNKKGDNVTPAHLFLRPGIHWVACPANLPPVNLPPTANAGADKTITLPQSSVALAGSGTDPDGTILVFKWTKISGPAQGTIQNSNSATATPASLVAGTYAFELKVTDIMGTSKRDTALVTVIAPANYSPLVNAGADITTSQTSLQLTGTASDPDGSIASKTWSQVAGPSSANILSPSSFITGINGLIVGNYSFALKVTDNYGAVSRDTVNVNVVAPPPPPPPPPPPIPNNPPVAKAGADLELTLPSNTAMVVGTGTDSDGSITLAKWTLLSGPACQMSTAGNGTLMNLSSLVEGIYYFQFLVRDNKGAEGKDTMRVKVKPQLRKESVAQLYPSITSSTMTLRIDAVSKKALTNLRIFNSAGVEVSSEQFLRDTETMVRTVNVGHLPSGAYYLSVTADIGKTISLKFIRQ